MDDFELITKLLYGIRQSEMGEKFNALDLFTKYKDETGKAIIPPQEVKWLSALALKLQDAGYIKGLLTDEHFGVGWQCSKPTLTLAGLEYMATNPLILQELNYEHQNH